MQRWPGGRFELEGLAEGLYAIGVLSPAHRFLEHALVELKRGAAAPDLYFELESGHALRGRVLAANAEHGLPGIELELVRVDQRSRDARQGLDPIFPWLFGEVGPRGPVVQRTRSGKGGSFAFGPAPVGSYVVSVHGDRIADQDSRLLRLPNGGRELRIVTKPRCRLEGRVLGLIPGEDEASEVVVLGGRGELRRVDVLPGGRYVVDGLQPGGYLVRVFPKSSRDQERRFFRRLFPLHAGAIDKEGLPPLDVTLAPGEQRQFDVRFERPPSGRVLVSIRENGELVKYPLAYLRPVASPEERARTLALRPRFDANDSSLHFERVPVGSYELRVYGATRQVLHEEQLEVLANAEVRRDLDLASGGLHGSVVSGDGAPRGGAARLSLGPSRCQGGARRPLELAAEPPHASPSGPTRPLREPLAHAGPRPAGPRLEGPREVRPRSQDHRAAATAARPPCRRAGAVDSCLRCNLSGLAPNGGDRCANRAARYPGRDMSLLGARDQ